jgi:hypothetical protein
LLPDLGGKVLPGQHFATKIYQINSGLKRIFAITLALARHALKHAAVDGASTPASCILVRAVAWLRWLRYEVPNSQRPIARSLVEAGFARRHR